MKNLVRGLWRLLQPIKLYGLRFPVRVSVKLFEFLGSAATFKRMGGDIHFHEWAPVLEIDNSHSQTGGGHYFYQDVWALRKLSERRPEIHYDVGSRLDGFVGQATAISHVVFVDIREPRFKLPNFEFRPGDITRLPFRNDSIASLSCLHTVEHIGLGRYGDELNPKGYDQALQELERVLMPGGHLMLSMPVGRERIEFNAQRILSPLSCIARLSKLDLVEFSAVTDDDEFIQNASLETLLQANYACGLYLFKKR